MTFWRLMTPVTTTSLINDVRDITAIFDQEALSEGRIRMLIAAAWGRISSDDYTSVIQTEVLTLPQNINYIPKDISKHIILPVFVNNFEVSMIRAPSFSDDVMTVTPSVNTRSLDVWFRDGIDPSFPITLISDFIPGSPAVIDPRFCMDAPPLPVVRYDGLADFGIQMSYNIGTQFLTINSSGAFTGQEIDVYHMSQTNRPTFSWCEIRRYGVVFPMLFGRPTITMKYKSESPPPEVFTPSEGMFIRASVVAEVFRFSNMVEESISWAQETEKHYNQIYEFRGGMHKTKMKSWFSA